MDHEIIYASAASGQLSERELARILATAHTNNEARGVSGMLLYESGSFLQVLEGDPAVVEEIFARISKDPRHRSVIVLRRGAIEKRTFGEWSMGLVTVNASVRALPGINDFLRTGVAGFAAEATLAGRVLKSFRDGQYRQMLKAA